MAGEHNALNATAAAALAAGLGVPRPMPSSRPSPASAAFAAGLKCAPKLNGITIIDDFAHHPTAIRETLRALRTAYPGRRLWAVLEPRSNTLRRNVFERELVESLAVADHATLAGVFHSEMIPDAERLHPDNVVGGLNAAGRSRCSFPMPTRLLPISFLDWSPGTSSPSFPTAASMASARSFPWPFNDRSRND